MLPDDERDAALHEALRIMRASGVSPRPVPRQRVKRRLLQRLAWDRPRERGAHRGGVPGRPGRRAAGRVMGKGKNRAVPWETWAYGLDGSVLACVECYFACVRKERYSCRVYKTPSGADRHRVQSGHRIEPVIWFAERPNLGFSVELAG